MRLKFLHSLVNQDKNCMLYKFFIAQWENPVTGDWVLQVKNDLSDFGLSHDLSCLKARSQNSFKDLVKKKAVEFAKEKFLEKKAIHSKLDNLYYPDLELQDYLKHGEISVEENRVLLHWRLRMAKFGDNYGEPKKLCPLCRKHLDSQETFFNSCEELKKMVKLNFKYIQIFKKTTKEIAQTLKKINWIRETHET